MASWFWKGDKGDDDWIPYSSDVCAKLEAGFASKTKSAKRVNTDPQRYVDTVDMIQVRKDDPDKQVTTRCLFVCLQRALNTLADETCTLGTERSQTCACKQQTCHSRSAECSSGGKCRLC
jgi:hypothetical protein